MMNDSRVNCTQIIKKVSALVREAEEKETKEGARFNFFSLYDMERDEVETHQRMLYLILNQMGSREMRKKILRKWFDAMGLHDVYRDTVWEIRREYFTTDGRPDLFFRAEKEHVCVIVELKIDAPDGKYQLERYKNYILKCGYTDYRIVYLTLEGKEPSAQSAGTVDRERLVTASFTGDIVGWLEDCISICGEYGADAGIIRQYRLLLTKLKGENGVNDGVRKIVEGDEEGLKACLQIEKALPAIKAEILYGFLREIRVEIKKKRLKIVWDAIEDAKDYYGGRQMIPCLYIEIAEIKTSAYGLVKLCMGLEVEYMLDRYIIFCRAENMEAIPSNEFAKRQKRIAVKTQEAIRECLHVEIRENNYKSIWWEHIGDTDGKFYDFKHFSEHCIKLVHPEIRKGEAARIVKNCAADIRNIRKTLC